MPRTYRRFSLIAGGIALLVGGAALGVFGLGIPPAVAAMVLVGVVAASALIWLNAVLLSRSRALLREEARKTAILNSALDAVVTMDHHGRIVDFNPAAERTFG